MTKEAKKYYNKHKKEYDEIIKILDENDKRHNDEIDKIKKERGLIRVNYDPFNNWEITTFTKKPSKSMLEIINEYANKENIK